MAVRAGTARMVDHAVQQEVCTVGAVGLEDRVNRLEPFPGFLRIDVFEAVEFDHGKSLTGQSGERV